MRYSSINLPTVWRASSNSSRLSLGVILDLVSMLSSVNLEHVGLFELVNVRVALLHLVKVNGGAVEEAKLIFKIHTFNKTHVDTEV